jgi:multidrug resistance efflux pump
VEVTPNVTGQIIAIPVKPNVPVKTNDVLFQIDPAPFQYKVTQLQASLAAAKQQVEVLKSNYEQATANVSGLTTQVAYNKKRLADIQTLAADEASTQFLAQDKQVQYETVSAQLDNAKWELSQTDVRAPADGYVTVVALTIGDRALQARSAMSFIVEKEITLVGMLSQNGSQTVKEGAVVDIVFDNAPGPHLSRQNRRDPEGHRPGADRRVGAAGAHQCARRGDGVSGRDLDTRRDEPRSASAGDVR